MHMFGIGMDTCHKKYSSSNSIKNRILNLKNETVDEMIMLERTPGSYLYNGRKYYWCTQ